MDSNTQLAVASAGVEVAEFSSGNQRDLEQVDPTAVSEGLYFVQRFKDTPGGVVALQEEARRVLPGFIQNQDAMLEYGSDALEAVRQSGRELRKLTGDVELSPEQERAMRDLMLELDKAKAYDPKVQANVDKFRDLMDKSKGFFGKRAFKAYVDAFNAQRATVEQMIESMRTSLKKEAAHRKVVANAIKAHYDVNDEAMLLMTERLAVLQIVRNLATAERAKYPDVIESTHPDAVKVRNLDMFLRMIQLKIQEYSQVWVVSLGSGAMFQVQQEMHTMAAFTTNVAATTGMDMAEQLLAQLATSQDLMRNNVKLQQQRAWQNQLVMDTVTQARSAVVAAAELATSASLTQETISGYADQVSGMIGDVQRVYSEAAQKYESNMTAIAQGAAIIEKAQGNQPVDPAQVQSVLQAGRSMRSITGAKVG